MTEAEQLQWGWLEQVHSADRDRVREEWRAAIRGGGNLDTELRIRGSSGGYRWFKTRAAPIRDAAGAIARWYGSATDIDRLKRAEDRLAEILGSLADGFLVVDEHHVVAAMNAGAERMLSCRAVDVIGHPMSDGVPALRELADQIRRAPGEPELALPRAGCSARIQASREGGYLIFLRPNGSVP